MNIENSAGATACASKDTEATKPENTATSKPLQDPHP